MPELSKVCNSFYEHAKSVSYEQNKSINLFKTMFKTMGFVALLFNSLLCSLEDNNKLQAC